MLLNRIDPRTKDAADMLEFLNEQKLPVLSTKVCERVAYRRSVGEGQLFLRSGKTHFAITEMESFFAEVHP